MCLRCLLKSNFASAFFVPLPLQVLQEMLDMLRDHQQNHHSARLEWIIIWLIAGMRNWLKFIPLLLQVFEAYCLVVLRIAGPVHRASSRLKQDIAKSICGRGASS
jgi:hypothetical protein